jgi:hypothetical protein
MRLAIVALGLTAAIVIATTSAVAARSAAQPFELVVIGVNEAVPTSPAFPSGIRHSGTFTATSPFCPSGVFWDLTNDFLNSFSDTRLYTCADDTGTLTTNQEDWFELKPPFTDVWRIVEGTGRYADLRGKGTFRGELLVPGVHEDPFSVVFRATYTGSVDFDSVGPTITVSSAKLTRLRRPAGTFSLRLGLSMRDNRPGNQIAYTVAVEPAGGGLYLVAKKGTAPAGKVALTLRFRPSSGARAVLLQLGGEDPVGNTRWSTKRLKLLR